MQRTAPKRATRPRDLIDTGTRRRLAAHIPADERTIDKVLRGIPVRGDVGTRILAALADLGIRPLVQPVDQEPEAGKP